MVNKEQAQRIKEAHEAIGIALKLILKTETVDKADIADALGIWLAQFAIESKVTKQKFTEVVENTWDMVKDKDFIIDV